MEASHFVDDEHAPPSAGNVFEPVDFGTEVSGGWKPARAGKPGRTAAIVVGGAVAAGAVAIAVKERVDA
jgi:hypothetical protein